METNVRDCLECRYAPIEASDEAALQALMEKDPGYADRTGEGVKPGIAREALESVPPGLTQDDIEARGLWVTAQSGLSELAAAVIVGRGYPDLKTAHIGLLIVDPDRRRQGFASRLHRDLLNEARTWREICSMRLGILDSNREYAQPLWEALGYRPTGERSTYELGAGKPPTVARIWALPLR